MTIDLYDFMDLTTLNPEQYQAVTLGKEQSLILAGAGSGKTKVLTQRIAYLCQQQQVPPLNILAVTFTNKAAKEMQGRIESLLGFSTYGMWIGTFHGIAHRLLRYHGPDLGIDKRFKVLDQEDQYQAIKKVLASLNLDEKAFPPKMIQGLINQQKDQGNRSVDVSSRFDPTIKRIYHAYELHLKANHALDFADLLLYAYELLRDHPMLRQTYQHRFQYILVDEFQDTNTIQYAWLELLAGQNNTLMVVGDDDQSIYGWRGAKVENIERFKTTFNPTLIRLEQNYRSTQTILQAANAVIANNEKRLGKNLWSTQPEGQKIDLYSAYNERDEAQFIVQTIQQLQDQSHAQAWSDMAILYRSNAQSRVLEEYLIQSNIPYRIYGGVRFFERAEIKDALAYLRLIAMPSDDMAFERVINTPTRGIGAKTLQQVRDHAETQQCSLWQAATEVSANAKTKGLKAVANFLYLIESFKVYQPNKTLAELTQIVIEQSGLLTLYQNQKTEKAQQKVDNLKELITAADEFIPPMADESTDWLTEFLAVAILESGETQADPDSDCLQLMTLHSAKGLEFPYVFLSGLEEGLFPSSRSIDDPGKLAEERRLCYVGITRAEKKLTISFAKNRQQYGETKSAIASRFIKELPTHLINHVRPTTAHQKPKGLSGGFGVSPEAFLKQKTPHSSVDEACDFTPGAYVYHPKFGVGVFLKQQGSGSDKCYHVDFQNGIGKKMLLADYAQLKNA